MAITYVMSVFYFVQFAALHSDHLLVDVQLQITPAPKLRDREAAIGRHLHRSIGG